MIFKDPFNPNHSMILKWPNPAECQQFPVRCWELPNPRGDSETQLPTGSGCTGDTDPLRNIDLKSYGGTLLFPLHHDLHHFLLRRQQVLDVIICSLSSGGEMKPATLQQGHHNQFSKSHALLTSPEISLKSFLFPAKKSIVIMKMTCTRPQQNLSRNDHS